MATSISAVATVSSLALVAIIPTGPSTAAPAITTECTVVAEDGVAADAAVADGACEVASCLDPVGTDEGGHGTHVAGTIGAAVNGLGVSGVAPNVTLVELKGGQNCGCTTACPGRWRLLRPLLPVVGNRWKKCGGSGASALSALYAEAFW